jgi:hypothetical protein
MLEETVISFLLTPTLTPNQSQNPEAKLNSF